MIIRKTFQGAYEISELVNGYLFTMQYMGYNKREAIKRFKDDIKKEEHRD